MEPASLFQDKPLSEQRALTIFRAAMIAREEANWKDLFAGFESLKVITYSSGLDVILQLAGMFQDGEDFVARTRGARASEQRGAGLHLC